MRAKISIILLILSLTINGCTNNGNNKSELKLLDKAPNSLEDVYKEISSILDNVGKIERINLDIDFEEEREATDAQDEQDPSNEEGTKNPQDFESTGNNENESNSQNQNKEDSNEGNEGSDGRNKDVRIKETWKDIDKSLEDIYLKWSDYENMGIKKGASKDRVTQLKEKINGLTKSIERREITNIYDLGSQSLLNLKPFFDLYKDDYRGEICDLKYSIYQYYIKAISNDKEGALNAINSKEENINRIRLLIGDDEKKIDELEKISSSLENVGISLEEDSKRVYILEKDTLIKNVESIE